MVYARLCRDVATIVILPLALSACGGLKDLVADRKTDRPDKTPLPRELEATARALDASEYKESCDDKFGALRIEVARELDRRVADMEKIVTEAPPSAEYKNVPAGPVIVREWIGTTEPEDKWQSFDKSWQKVQDVWNEYKDTPTDASWVRLNSYVRALMTDDEDRIIYGDNFYLTRGDLKTLPALKADIDACEIDESCMMPKLGVASGKLAQRNHYYQYFLRKIQSGERVRELIGKWKKFVDSDIKGVSFTRNDSIKLVDGKVLEVPMNPGPFRGQEGVIEAYLESFWKSSDLAVDVKWVDDEQAFSIVIDEDVGSRAYVAYKKKELHIANGVRNGTLVHEFGHVLGLADEYYTQWNRDTCVYSYEHNEANIMSDSSAGGTATAKHWQAIKAQYAPQ